MIVDDIKNSIKSSYNGIKKGTLNISKLNSYNRPNRPNGPTVFRMPNNNSKIRQIIHYLCENKQPFENYKFLILLSDDYFTRKIKILPTRKYYIKKIPFPGKLQIEKYSEMKYNSTKYSFESNPVPNQLYIKLQKEQIYVLYSEYEYKLLESQFNEFYDILTLIGAKYIKMSKIIKNLENSNFSTEIGLNTVCENAKISNKVSMKNEKDTALLLTQEMSFNNDKDPELNKIIDNNYYYLPNQMDLQSLIIRRIENNQTNDKYTYIHTENNLINRKVLTKLSKFNIGNSLSFNFDYSFKQISNFQIEYTIEFYNIKNKNLNKINIDEDDEKPWLIKMVSKFINEYYNN